MGGTCDCNEDCKAKIQILEGQKFTFPEEAFPDEGSDSKFDGYDFNKIALLRFFFSLFESKKIDLDFPNSFTVHSVAFKGIIRGRYVFPYMFDFYSSGKLYSLWVIFDESADTKRRTVLARSKPILYRCFESYFDVLSSGEIEWVVEG